MSLPDDLAAQRLHQRRTGELTREGEAEVLTHGFAGFGERDQSEGRGGRYEVGVWRDLRSAIAAVQGLGVQGDPGEVSEIEWVRWEGGLIEKRVVRHVYGRRKDEHGYYTVGLIPPEPERH